MYPAMTWMCQEKGQGIHYVGGREGDCSTQSLNLPIKTFVDQQRGDFLSIDLCVLVSNWWMSHALCMSAREVAPNDLPCCK